MHHPTAIFGIIYRIWMLAVFIQYKCLFLKMRHCDRTHIKNLKWRQLSQMQEFMFATWSLLSCDKKTWTSMLRYVQRSTARVILKVGEQYGVWLQALQSAQVFVSGRSRAHALLLQWPDWSSTRAWWTPWRRQLAIYSDHRWSTVLNVCPYNTWEF